MGQHTELCEHLAPLLRDELAAGNVIREVGPAPGPSQGVLVLLGGPFRVPRAEVPSSLRLTAVKDPHWWDSEYVCLVHQHVLAAAFQ